MQQQQQQWLPYQMPMMPMPQMFGFNQFMQPQMKPSQSDFYVRKSKEEQQLQNQQYQQMFDPQFGFPFMPMLPMMMPFFNNNMGGNYNAGYNNDDFKEEDEDNYNKEKEDEKKNDKSQQQQQQQQSSEKNQRGQKYGGKRQYKPKYPKQQQQQQQYQQRPRGYRPPQQQSQQQKSRVRMDSDSFPALPEAKFIYQKKEIQPEAADKIQEDADNNNNNSEVKTSYTSKEIQKIFSELKDKDLIKMNENLCKLDENELPILLKEGQFQLEIIQPSKITKRKEEKFDVYYEKEKPKRKNTYDNQKIMSRHKFSLQITTYEKKEVK